MESPDTAFELDAAAAGGLVKVRTLGRGAVAESIVIGLLTA